MEETLTLHEIPQVYKATDVDDFVYRLQTKIKELESPWIPISERLPKATDNTFVLTNKGFTECMLFDKACDGWMAGWDDGLVTHWMPIPELPEFHLRHEGR